METMHYSEKKKSSKGVIIGILLFVLLGSGIIFFAVSSETEPVVIGSEESDIQRLVELEKEETISTANQNSSISYEIKEVKHSDSSNIKIKSNMTIPQIFVEGEALEEFNTEIDVEYQELFTKLQEQMKAVESKYTYLVSYNTYENMVGTKKIVSLTVYQRVRDDSAKKNTTEKVTTYNIDLATKEIVEESEVAKELLGKDYKTVIKSAAQDYVVGKGMIKESEFTYALTGLEDYYIKDGVFHIIFNEGKLVDSKYGVLDIEVKSERE